jgi:hypothetical protein
MMEAATTLVDEIREHGTHQTWKTLAHALRSATEKGEPT